MGEPERNDVGRMVVEDAFPDRERAIEVAGNPRLERADMRPLAGGGLDGQRARRLRGRRSGRHIRLLVGQHGEIALQAVGEAELRIGEKGLR